MNVRGGVEESERTQRRRGANPLRDTNAAEEEEVAVSDVTVNDDDCASKNNATSVVLQHFGFTRQTASPSKVPHKRMSVRCGWR